MHGVCLHKPLVLQRGWPGWLACCLLPYAQQLLAFCPTQHFASPAPQSTPPVCRRAALAVQLPPTEGVFKGFLDGMDGRIGTFD